ncbi:MAG: polyprenyl synthetase family protein, partial [Mesorhizobium sp.]
NGGKRLRPFLVMESAALFSADGEAALRVAAALECVHCYSLVHDDLPAMDDDDLRRGQPTVHRAFDEATAILAGDALLTLAFDIIAGEATALPAERRAALVLALAADASQMGKATGKDAAAGKATLVALHGPNWARSQLHGLVAQAHALLEPYGDDAQLLKEAATFVATRTS